MPFTNVLRKKNTGKLKRNKESGAESCINMFGDDATVQRNI